jgi:hypothetical protein
MSLYPELEAGCDQKTGDGRMARSVFSRIAVRVLLIALAVVSLLGCTDSTPKRDGTSSVGTSAVVENEVTPSERAIEGKPNSEENPAEIELVVAPAAGQRRGGLSFDVRVTNKSDQNAAWDREFATFLVWHVEVDDSRVIEPKGLPLEGDARERAVEKRFVMLKPGEEFVRRVDLDKEVWTFVWGSGLVTTETGESVIMPNAGEGAIRYELPADARKARVWLEYEAWAHPEAEGCFSLYFGASVSAVGLPWRSCKSNVVEVEVDGG